MSTDSSSDSHVEAQTAVILASALYATAVIFACGSFLAGPAEIQASIALSCALGAYLVTTGVARGINRPVTFAASMFLVQVCGLVALGMTTAVHQSLREGMLVYILIIGIPVCTLYWVLRNSLTRVTWHGIFGVLRKSSGLVPHLVLAVAMLMMIRILVSIRLGNDAVANYTFASLVIGGSITIAASLDAHWSVRAQASKSIDILQSALRRNQTKTQLLLMITSIGIALFLLLILDPWLPGGYDRNAVITAVLFALPGASLQAVADGRAAVLMWINRPALISVSTALGTFSTMLLAYYLMPIYGWPSVGLCLTTGLAVRAFTTIVMARKFSAGSTVGAVNLVFLLAQFLFASTLIVSVNGVDNFF
ncbi:hypothetical protein [Pseudarthrobacter sp. N5]|uniref:hypothetical protein n=1 Tax=Pseudarthrobacter sp. N5 TaxID=3418416 RepID=UPI003CEECCA5